MRVWQGFCALVLPIFLAGCATWSAVPGVDGYRLNLCEKTDAQTLRLSGPIDERMEVCVSRYSDDVIKRVIISSQGGSVRSALRIGETIATWHAELVIEGECVSSCANYFVPVASRVVLHPGGAIVLHGSIDEGFIDKNRNAMNPAALDGSRETVRLQRLYADRFDIPPAWLLTRQRYSSPEMNVDGLEGEFVPFHPSGRAMAFLVAEAPFLRSCFPHIAFEGLEDMLSERARVEFDLARTLAANKFARSGDARCRNRSDRG